MFTSRPLTRLSSVPRAASKPTQQAARFSRSARRYDQLPQNPKRPGLEDRKGVLYPKTRIAVGIVFCGTLIYSMVMPLLKSALADS